MKLKIEIKNYLTGAVLFEYEKENNTLKDTLVKAVKEKADLHDADLRGANLYDANLRGANLYDANLRGANLRGADLRGANLYDANLYDANLRGANLHDADLHDADLRGANLYGANLRGADLHDADLRGADLYGADLKNLPQDFINQCSRDILFIFSCLPNEVPFLKERLLNGEIDGSQYEGNCACLIGTLANGDGGIEKVCETIPYYEKGTHNYGEMWFLNIKKGDNPKNNAFAKHVLGLITLFEKRFKK